MPVKGLFQCNPVKTKHDDYFTRKEAWKDIECFIPRGKKIWEAFYHPHSSSAEHLRQLGFDVVYTDSDFFTDTWSEHILTNHNLYTYHQYSIQGCDLVFDPHKQDHGRVPEDLLEIVELMDSFFAGEKSGEIEAKFAVLMKPYMRQNKEEEQSLQQQ